jgi:hypothetical protein
MRAEAGWQRAGLGGPGPQDLNVTGGRGQGELLGPL